MPFSRLRYPRLLLLLTSFIAAYALYYAGAFDALPRYLHGYGYVTAFVGGMLLSFGFTTAFGLAILIAIAPDVSLPPAVFIASCGALLSDMLLFSFVRLSLHEEIMRLSTHRALQWLKWWIHHPSLSDRMRNYILWSLGGILIASPLPDEFGVLLLTGARLHPRLFALTCFMLDAIGILAIFLLARAAA